MIEKIFEQVKDKWNQTTEQGIKDFIEIPALSPDFDKKWEENGVLLKAVEFAKDWVEKQDIKGLSTKIVQEEGFPPCLYVEIEASEGNTAKESVFLYGHLDKQPPNLGWDEDKGPWKPVVQDGKLYGRGAADDGYSFFCSLSAVKALQELNISHPRCVGLFETCEESGSAHYETYLKHVEEQLGAIGLVVALDSSCGDYDRLWITNSLRGMIGGAIKVEVLKEGVHSGEASGIVPSSFMILRSLLDRVEDSKTGKVIGIPFHTVLTSDILKQSKKIAKILGDKAWEQFPWAGETSPLCDEPMECILRRNWEPALTVTGADGISSVENGGNVLRPWTKIKIGMRLPPNVEASLASQAFKDVVTAHPPFNAKVDYEPVVMSNGWVAKEPKKWLKKSFKKASKSLWGNDFCYLGMGASIPLLNVFSREWPSAEFVVAGVLGPKSNAHGPNEFLHIDYAQKLTASVAYIIAKMAKAEE